MNSVHYVIIGNSAAAVGCVEGIRQADSSGPITVISAEKHHTYSRPLISYLLQGKTDTQRMRYRPEGFYRDMGCQAILGCGVCLISPSQKAVELENGESVYYDKLLIATGSKPVEPPIPGLREVENRFFFYTLDDAKALAKALQPDSRVLILGAGLIGLKCAEGIAHRAGSITVVDLADRVLPSVLDAQAGEIVQRHLEEHGIGFLLSDGVKAFTAPRTALLQSGKSLEFDALVVAVGVRPNTALAAQAGIAVERGIAVDACGRTSLPDIYAAGDCTESVDICTGERRVLALLPNAYMQGEAAGMHMAGGEKLFDRAMPMNAVGFFGLHLVTAGCCEGESVIIRERGGYKKLATQDNLLKGFMIVGDVARAGIYTSLIRDRIPLNTLDFELISESPQLMAFSRHERAVRLGGVKA